MKVDKLKQTKAHANAIAKLLYTNVYQPFLFPLPDITFLIFSRFIQEVYLVLVIPTSFSLNSQRRFPLLAFIASSEISCLNAVRSSC